MLGLVWNSIVRKPESGSCRFVKALDTALNSTVDKSSSVGIPLQSYMDMVLCALVLMTKYWNISVGCRKCGSFHLIFGLWYCPTQKISSQLGTFSNAKRSFMRIYSGYIRWSQQHSLDASRIKCEHYFCFKTTPLPFAFQGVEPESHNCLKVFPARAISQWWVSMLFRLLWQPKILAMWVHREHA